MQLIRSKNPEQDSQKLSLLSLLFGIGSFLFWILGFVGLGLGIRAAVLSKRVGNNKNFVMAIIGSLLSLVTVINHLVLSL
jgi:uncharacterized membrane protein